MSIPLSVIPQIVTGQITCGLFLKRYRDMEQKPALVKLTQRCVIENTIANALCCLLKGIQRLNFINA